jgi:hypothetical protein
VPGLVHRSDIPSQLAAGSGVWYMALGTWQHSCQKRTQMESGTFVLGQWLALCAGAGGVSLAGYHGLGHPIGLGGGAVGTQAARDAAERLAEVLALQQQLQVGFALMCSLLSLQPLAALLGPLARSSFAYGLRMKRLRHLDLHWFDADIVFAFERLRLFSLVLHGVIMLIGAALCCRHCGRCLQSASQSSRRR